MKFIRKNKYSNIGQLEVVKDNGYLIQQIHNPSEQVQLEAVKENGCSIQHIHNPSEQVQLEAVKENGHSIQYIHNPSEHVFKYMYDKKKGPLLVFYHIEDDG